MARNSACRVPQLPASLSEEIHTTKKKIQDDVDARFRFRYVKNTRRLQRLGKRREKKTKAQLHHLRVKEKIIGKSGFTSNPRKQKLENSVKPTTLQEAPQDSSLENLVKPKHSGKKSSSQLKNQKFFKSLGEQNLLSAQDRKKIGVSFDLELQNEDEIAIQKLEKQLGLDKSNCGANKTVGDSDLDYILNYKEDVMNESTHVHSQSEPAEMDIDSFAEDDQDLSQDDSDEHLDEDELSSQDEDLDQDLDEDLDEEEEEEEDSSQDGEKNTEMIKNSTNLEETKMTRNELNKKEEEPREKNTLKPSTIYKPPHLRNLQLSKEEEKISNLKKQVMGFMNRVSEANMEKITQEMEKIYENNSFHDMNAVVSSILLELCLDGTKMLSRLLLVNSALIACLSHVVGVEVGAALIQTLAVEFEKRFSDAKNIAKKECLNILTVFCFLYNFQVVHSNLIFDFVTKFLAKMNEPNVEMLLIVMKTCGFQLRRENPQDFKDMILEIQKVTSSSALQDSTSSKHPHHENQDEEEKSLNPARVKFMLETIYDIKNNRKRIGTVNQDSSACELLGNCVKTIAKKKSNRLEDITLRVSYSDLMNVNQNGRWWLIGSAWMGKNPDENKKEKEEKGSKVNQNFDSEIPELMEIAKHQKMNTDVRRSIFSIIMSAEDFLDCFEKLLKLNLKGQQEREIIRVIVDCCLQEKTYNPFYAYLSEKFCRHDYNFKFTFQYTFWDKLKGMDKSSAACLREIFNLASLLSFLVSVFALPISVLKSVDFDQLSQSLKMFFRIFFSQLFSSTSEQVFEDIFRRLSSQPKFTALKEGILDYVKYLCVKKAFVFMGASEEKKSSLLQLCLRRYKLAKVILREENIGAHI